jgi:sulfite exporter TauE/SafE
VPDFALPLATLLPHTVGPYVALMLIGFATGILGHLSASRWLVAIGVILIFLGAFLFPLALNLTESTPPQVEERAREAE